MALKIFYEELDGMLSPKLVLLPNILNEDSTMLTYSVEIPFERFYQEDFHDDLRIISVSQAALQPCPFYDHQFHMNIHQIRLDIEKQGHDPRSIEETEYFSCLVDDLQELLAYDVVRRFVG
ncbi:hypothetical protein [Halalkalibacter nanhaiisediminis]|uniref:Uncharacterized protein n=1 Tax=Halalkalibacter nanhaiisediminis TaxID=688079 RepID=A0A562QBA1_9BACI|nr:hypothetical protein [Halalkalibacter nanhaiisediminis]TWI53989.1 hypothetical protein IQ10_03299 [Halalkalibacter nanhaiisediminis]